MPPAFNHACVPYNDAWQPHRLSAYGVVCTFCQAKHWIAEKQSTSTIANPVFTLCCHAGKVCSIYSLGFRTPVLIFFFLIIQFLHAKKYSKLHITSDVGTIALRDYS